MKDYDYFFNSYISFYKVSTDNKILKGGKFELYSADNTASGKTFEQNLMEDII